MDVAKLRSIRRKLEKLEKEIKVYLAEMRDFNHALKNGDIWEPRTLAELEMSEEQTPLH